MLAVLSLRAAAWPAVPNNIDAHCQSPFRRTELSNLPFDVCKFRACLVAAVSGWPRIPADDHEAAPENALGEKPYAKAGESAKVASSHKSYHWLVCGLAFLIGANSQTLTSVASIALKYPFFPILAMHE